jgi:hypothetical protein
MAALKSFPTALMKTVTSLMLSTKVKLNTPHHQEATETTELEMETAPTVATTTAAAAAEMEAADTAMEMVAQNQTAIIATAMAMATNLALIKNNVIKCLCVA